MALRDMPEEAQVRGVVYMTDKYPTAKLDNGRLMVSVSWDTMQNPEGWDRLIKNCIRGLSILLFMASVTHILSGWWVALNYLGIFVSMAFIGIVKFEWIQHDYEILRIEVWS